MKSIYHFHTADYIVAGKNATEELADKLKQFGRNISNVLVVTQNELLDIGLLDSVYEQLEILDCDVQTVTNILPEPTIGNLTEIHSALNAGPFDYIIGVGGGSVLDASKILSVLQTNKDSLSDMLKENKVQNKGVPTVLIPTTSGTGSEVTPNAIVTLPEQELKVGLVSRYLLPDLVILDPVLTLGLPKPITAATGMDAFTHAIESFISNKSNKLSDTFALESMRLISNSIETAYLDGSDVEARENMLIGSMYGGMALTSAGTAAVHALAYPLGGKFNIPHGVANSMLLPHVMAFNSDAIAERLSAVAEVLGVKENGHSKEQSAEIAIQKINDWIKLMDIPQDLKEFGVAEEDIEELAVSASKVTRLLNNNPKRLNIDEIKDLYRQLIY